MIRVREAIVVEGRYDKAALSNLVDGVILETEGFGIFSDREKLALLRRLAEKRGLIVLTDSDGGGFLIRSFLRGAIDRKLVKHAYIPDIPGRERRKRRPGREGKLGVEGMPPEILLDSLRRAGASIVGETAADAAPPLTKAELYALGLTGTPGSAARRDAVKAALGLPQKLTPNALLDVLNILVTREELRALAERPGPGEGPPGEAGEDPPGEAGEDPPGEAGEDPPGEAGEDPPGVAREEIPRTVPNDYYSGN